MREDMYETKQWRSSDSRMHSMKGAFASEHLSTDVIDAAFEQESPGVVPMSSSRRQRVVHSKPTKQMDIIQSLSVQLEMLDSQREHIQRLLDQAQN